MAADAWMALVASEDSAPAASRVFAVDMLCSYFYASSLDIRLYVTLDGKKNLREKNIKKGGRSQADVSAGYLSCRTRGGELRPFQGLVDGA